MTTRAKFRCANETRVRWGANEDNVTRSYEFQAMYDASQPEDERYAKATPTGQLKITVDNPNVTFEPGRGYYLDITPVNEPAPAADA